MEFRACYIKVKIVGPLEVNVRSRNMGGTHRQTVGKLYGIRDVKSTRDRDQPNVSSACLEFKCSGMLYDQDRVDRTLVKVIPQGSCHRASVNSMLHEYLVNHLPLAVNNDTSEYTMLAPLDPLGHNYGIYTVTDQDPRTAKEIALGRCFDGTSDGSSRIMKSNVGVALTFNCAERQVGRQSAFQYLQSTPARSPATGTVQGRVPAMRQQRASRGGLRRRGSMGPSEIFWCCSTTSEQLSLVVLSPFCPSHVTAVVRLMHRLSLVNLNISGLVQFVSLCLYLLSLPHDADCHRAPTMTKQRFSS